MLQSADADKKQLDSFVQPIHSNPQHNESFTKKQIHRTRSISDTTKAYRTSKWTCIRNAARFYRAKLRVALYCQGKLSVCPSVCNVEVSWSYRFEFLENNFTAD